jgi:hypothetical protein
VREGRRFAEALRALGFRAEDPDDADVVLAEELARALVRRADTRHEGWRNLRQALQHAGAEPPWTQCQRQAQHPTAERILRDCAKPGHTPMLRVQHAAAQELAKAVAAHTDPDDVLPRLLGDAPREPVSAADWERALVSAVRARSLGGVGTLIDDSLARIDNA